MSNSKSKLDGPVTDGPVRLTCAACSAEFNTLTRQDGTPLDVLTPQTILVCVYCGTVLIPVSPAESRIADVDDEVPQEMYDLANEIVYNPRFRAPRRPSSGSSSGSG